MKRFVLILSLMALMVGMKVAACNNSPPVLQHDPVIDTDLMMLTKPAPVFDVVVVAPAFDLCETMLIQPGIAETVSIITPVVTAITCTGFEVVFHPPDLSMDGGSTLVTKDVHKLKNLNPDTFAHVQFY